MMTPRARREVLGGDQGAVDPDGGRDQGGPPDGIRPVDPVIGRPIWAMGAPRLRSTSTASALSGEM